MVIQIGFWKFNEKGEVTAYDAWIPNLQRWTEIANGVNFGSSIVGTGIPLAICPEIQKRCKDGNEQFANSLDCMAKLEMKPTGHFDEAWGDNMVCRLIHFQLTIVRPEVRVTRRQETRSLADLVPQDTLSPRRAQRRLSAQELQM